MLRDLKVWIVAGTLGQGGAERQLFYQLRALRDAGARPRVLSLTRGEFWEAPIREMGVQVTWVGRSASRAGRLIRIVREARRGSPNVLQSQHYYANLYVALAARALGLREIGAVRNNVMFEVETVGRMSLVAPRMLAINSEAGLRNAVAKGVPASRCHLLPNVVDEKWFRPAARDERPEVRILGIGRLVPQKRFDRFVEVVAAARERSDRPIRARLVGSGPLREMLERAGRALGLDPPALEFQGAVADPREAYESADVLLLTSDWEGTPNVVLEAAASGLPVVAPRVGDLSELVEDGRTGLLVEPGDVEGLVEAVVRIASDREASRTMGERARTRVVATRSVSRLPDLLEALYRRALA